MGGIEKKGGGFYLSEKTASAVNHCVWGGCSNSSIRLGRIFACQSSKLNINIEHLVEIN